MADIEIHDEVVEWLNQLNEDDWHRAVVIIDRLAELDQMVRMPLSRSLGGGLFELRFALGPTTRRITFRFASGGRIVLLTAFRKQRDNERIEIARARRVAEACARSES